MRQTRYKTYQWTAPVRNVRTRKWIEERKMQQRKEFKQMLIVDILLIVACVLMFLWIT